MGLITQVQDSIVTYDVNLATLKKIIATDLGVNVEAIEISVKMKSIGGYRDEGQEFDGLTVRVNMRYNILPPPGVRGDKNLGTTVSY